MDLPQAESAAAGFDWSSYQDEDQRYWDELPDGDLFGRLIVESADIDGPVIKGDSAENLRRAPGWMVGTDAPGPTGNVGLAGHRTTYGAQFASLNEATVGDEIIIVSPYRTYRYEVSLVSIVAPTEVSVVDTTEEPTVTLIACHPRFSARERLVVQGILKSVVRNP